MAKIDPVRVFTLSECAHCQDVKDALKTGNFDIHGLTDKPAVEIVNLETDDLAPYGHLTLDAVPTAYHGINLCKISVDNETHRVVFDCKPAVKSPKKHRKTRGV